MSQKISSSMFAIAAIIFVMAVAIVKYWEIWSTPTNQDEYGDKYSKSQYVLGPKSDEWISDSELYVYAGFAYIKGQDPTTINFEHPPLAKYITGLSQLLTGNAYLVNLVLYPFLLWLVCLFSSIIVSNEKIKASIVVLFGLQPIVFTQLQYALLDLVFVSSILGLFIVLHQKFTSNLLKYIVVGCLLGVIAAVKYPIPFIFIPSAIVGLVAFKNSHLKYLILSGFFAAVIYLLSYSMYFYHGHSILDFLAFEKYRYVWWIGDRTMPKFLIFQNLFTGKFPAWWDGGPEQVTKDWNIILPITFVLFVTTISWSERKFWNLLIAGFGLGMIFVYGYASASALRYLILLLPFWLTAIGSIAERNKYLR